MRLKIPPRSDGAMMSADVRGRQKPAARTARFIATFLAATMLAWSGTVAAPLVPSVGVASAQDVLPPREVLHRLMSERLEPDLPYGFSVNPPANQPSVSGLQSIAPGYPGLVGAAIAELRGPDLTNTIWYYVFESNDAALRHFDYGDLGRVTTSSSEVTSSSFPSEARLTEAYSPEGIDIPVWCVAARTGPWGWTSCSILIDNVEVIGYSKVMPGSGLTRGDDARALSLAQSAGVHLLRLLNL